MNAGKHAAVEVPAAVTEDGCWKLVETAELKLRELGLSDIGLSIDTGNVASKIVEFSQENDVDLIVMGRRGLGDLGGLLMGSVSHKVCHLADCACLTVK